jgi:hypothetical protein
MRNIRMSIDGDDLIIRVSMSQEFGESRTGRSIIVASTDGSAGLPFSDAPDIKVNMTCYKANPDQNRGPRW